MTDQTHDFDLESAADLDVFLTVEEPVDAPAGAPARHVSASDTDVDFEDFGDRRYFYIDDMIRNERDPSRFEGSAYNLKMILENDPRTSGMVAYDEFTDRIVVKKNFAADVRGVNDWRVKSPLGDSLSQKHILTLQTFFQAPYRTVGVDGGYKTNANKEIVKDALTGVAFNQTFDSLKESLTILEWDGVPRIHSFFPAFFGAPADAYHAEVAKLFFVGAVTRAYEPGHKFDSVLSIIGGQGTRKTTAVEILGGCYSRAITKNAFVDPKKLIEQTVGSWIVELPENSALKKVSDDERKAMITARVDRDRMSYEKFAEDYERRWIMVITANEMRFLTDKTGNRRYLPVKVVFRHIDTDGMMAVRDQLWAEAVQIYRQMRLEKPEGMLPLMLPEEVENVARQKQELSRMGDDIEDTIAEIRSFLETPKGDGDLEVEGELYYAELDKREIWHAISGGQVDLQNSVAGQRRLNAALSMIDYVVMFKKPAWLRRNGKSLKKTSKVVIDLELFRKALREEEETFAPTAPVEDIAAVAPVGGMGEDGQGVGGREEKSAEGMEMGGEAPAAADSFDDLDEQAPAEEPAPAPVAEVKEEVAAPEKVEPAPAPQKIDQLDESPF